jgi:hypothetical protein
MSSRVDSFDRLIYDIKFRPTRRVKRALRKRRGSIW